MVDVKQIQNMAVPDAKGTVLPLTATRGSLVITAGSGKRADAMHIVVNSGIYNPQTATCGYGCETCNGCTGFGITPDPFNLFFGAFGQLNSNCTWSNGSYEYYTGSSNWTSNNTGVVTVNSQGSSSPGMAHAQAAGSTYANAYFSAPVNMGQICAEMPLPECGYTQAEPSTPATVYSVTINSADITQNSISVTLSPSGASGALYVELDNTGGGTYDSVDGTNVSGGTSSQPFNPPDIPKGEYTQITAVWVPSDSSNSYAAQYSYHFKALGTYLNTFYNTPDEAGCTARPESFLYDSGNCSSVSTCKGSNGSGRSDFLNQLDINGSGISQSLGLLSLEYYCRANNYRQVPAPCPYCGGTLTSGVSLAISASNQDGLQCGNNVYVYGIGTGTVADHGGGLSGNQIDHYEQTNACTANIGTPTNEPAFLLY
ncbi:MAG: hypothetical protein JO061_16490 [Acidobacteriaceae bacterium]|nr:hypothetical protein [Acidobacteriaceae bacterium]